MSSRGETTGIQRLLAQKLARSLDKRGRFKRLLSRVPQGSTRERNKGNTMYSGWRRSCTTGSEESPGQGSHRKGSTGSGGTRLLQHLFLDTKENRGLEANPQPETPQSECESTKIQNGQSEISYGGPKERPVGFHHRSEGCVSTHPSSSESQEILPLCLEYGGTFSVQMPLFRSLDSPEDLYKGSSSIGRDATFKSRRGISVPRRLARGGLRQRASRDSESSGNFVNPTGGVFDKLGKVPVDGGTGISVPGSVVQPEERHSSGFPRESSQIERMDSRVVRRENGDSRSSAGTVRPDGLLYRDSTICTFAHETNSTLSPKSLETFLQGDISLHSGRECFETPSSMVARHTESPSRSFSRETNTAVDGGDRRKPSRLGWLRQGFLGDSPGCLEPSRTETTHKCVRDEGCEVVSTSNADLGERESSSVAFGQHYSSIISAETGGNTLSQSMYVHMGPSAMVQVRGNHVGSPTHSRYVQQDGRSSLETESGTHRVVIEQGGGAKPVSDIRNTTCGPVCLSTEQPTANFLQSLGGEHSLGNRCPVCFMGRHDCICLPPYGFTESSSEEAVRLEQLPHDLSGPKVASAVVVCSNNQTDLRLSQGDSIPMGSIDTAEREAGTSRSNDIQTSGVATVKRNLRSKGFSKTAARLFMAAVRKSTAKVYGGRFQEFSRWCQRRGYNPYSCSLTIVANFLASLFKRSGTKRLTYSSICGYRSAISAYHDPVDGRKVGEHPSIARLIKGVFNLRPPLKPVPPQWDLDVVLKALKGKPFEPLLKTSLKWITLKTVFLVALATAARSSDLTKLVCTEPYMRERQTPQGLVFLPSDLKKQSRESHMSEEINVVQFKGDRRLDPLRAVRLYLRQIKPFRGSETSLFLTFKKGAKHKPSPQTISRWLVQTIQVAYELQNLSLESKVKGHSTRSTATSWALLQGASISSIVRAADWSSTNVFANHYLRELRREREEFSSTVLSGQT